MIDEDKIIEFFNKGLSLRAIAREVKLSHPTVSVVLKRNGINICQKRTKLNDFLISEVIRLYKDGMFQNQIVKYLNIGIATVTKCLKLRNVEIKRDNTRIYTLDESVFDVIDDEKKAYWLGFLFADVYIRNKVRNNKTHEYFLRLKLSIKDKNHVLKFREFLKTNCPLKYEIHKGNESCYIQINCKKLVQKLIDYGCVCNKSLVLKFPNFINKEMMVHFIRGYFDGDGWITKEKYRLKFGLVGTYEFLYDIRSILMKELNIFKYKIMKRQSIHCICYGSKKSISDTFNYLYSNATLFLKRKYEIFKLGELCHTLNRKIEKNL